MPGGDSAAGHQGDSERAGSGHQDDGIGERGHQSDRGRPQDDSSGRPPRDETSRNVPAAGAGNRQMWIGRQTRPDRLDIASDRGELFHVWRERWDDYVLLTGLKREEPRVQMAALRDCLTDDSIRVLRNLELSDSDRSDLNKSIDALEKYANGQVNEVVERKKFNERVQAEGEPFDDFLTSL